MTSTSIVTAANGPAEYMGQALGVSMTLMQSMTVVSDPAFDGLLGVEIDEEFYSDEAVAVSVAQSSSMVLGSFLETGPSPRFSGNTFPNALAEIRDDLDAVLACKDDADELEHQAILFWPVLSQLQSWLGKGRRESELIAHFDIFRAQFRLQPVTAAALIALRTALHKAATASVLTEDVVDECLDILEGAGADLRFPLSFTGSNED